MIERGSREADSVKERGEEPLEPMLAGKHSSCLSLISS